MSQNLWAPWRMAYVARIGKNDGGCFLCAAADPAATDGHDLVVARDELCVCVMNQFPYNNGHLLVAPRRHEADLEALSAEETAAMMAMIQKGLGLLRRTIKAQGFNVGWNLGRVAGAGLADHLHAHIVPRWAGDTNFMPVVADVKVIPQSLEDLRARLVKAWSGEDAQP
ncbi:MAG TPA: HIT domain-containing protein [Candidatus Brocadiia bacterium]|nr:HIT domain-containing protein [Candidatus Brocadiia bacterium]